MKISKKPQQKSRSLQTDISQVIKYQTQVLRSTSSSFLCLTKATAAIGPAVSSQEDPSEGFTEGIALYARTTTYQAHTHRVVDLHARRSLAQVAATVSPSHIPSCLLEISMPKATCALTTSFRVYPSRANKAFVYLLNFFLYSFRFAPIHLSAHPALPPRHPSSNTSAPRPQSPPLSTLYYYVAFSADVLTRRLLATFESILPIARSRAVADRRLTLQKDRRGRTDITVCRYGDISCRVAAAAITVAA